MNEEEKKAIDIVKNITEDDLLNYWEGPEEPYNAIQIVLNLIKKQQKDLEQIEKEHKEENGILRDRLNNEIENHKVLSLDITQACVDLGLPEDTIIADELVLEINKRYINKEKIKKIVDLYNNTLQCTRKYNQELADILCDLQELLEESDK